MSFVPPPYPQDRLDDLRTTAAQVDGGAIDASIGSPIDPMPAVVIQALAQATPGATGYPRSVGSPEYRQAASTWLAHRLGVDVGPDDIAACVGMKELVVSLPRILSLRDPSRDTVLYPAVSYPSYAMGAELAGLRAVSVPLDDDWLPRLDAVADADAERALVLWLNQPGNPTGSHASAGQLTTWATWARERGIIVASDECYVEFDPEPSTVLRGGSQGVLALHSLSKRSNMAGLRAGFVAGDPELVRYLGEVRKHAGLMVPSPVQAAAVAALGDDDHVVVQRERYDRRRAALLPAFEAIGLRHAGGPSTFYLWLAAADGADGWEIAKRLVEYGLVCAPGDLYGPDGAPYARVSLTIPDDAVDRLATLLMRQ